MSDPNPTTGLGVATAVVLTGTGVVLIVPVVPGTRGTSQYAVSVPIGGSVQITALPVDDSGTTVPPYLVNAITLASAPISVPSWYRPSTQGKSYSNSYMAPAVLDANNSNPWTVRGRFPGQVTLLFQLPTFENTEGQSLVNINRVYDETYIDTIDASLLVTVTGGTS